MLDIFTTPDHVKRAIIALLIKLSAIDGKNDLKEVTYTIQVANLIGLSAEDVRDIAMDPDQYELEPPTDEPSRMTILYYLLFLMDADGEVSIEEEQLVQEFGFRLGVRTELTRQLIAVIKQYSNSRVPPSQMLEKIKIYLN